MSRPVTQAVLCGGARASLRSVGRDDRPRRLGVRWAAGAVLCQSERRDAGPLALAAAFRGVSAASRFGAAARRGPLQDRRRSPVRDALLARNAPEDIAARLREALSRRAELEAKSAALKERRWREWRTPAETVARMLA